jgi:chemotaxis protein CheD
MYHPERHVSAICHAFLPEETVPGDPYRYVDSAISAMLRHFEQHGMQKNHLEVKLFGGAEIFRPSETGSSAITVGQQNILRATQIIKQEGLNLVASDVGGTRGRKLLYHSHTGKIYLKRLSEFKG